MAATGETVSFREYEDRANRIAQLFRATGLVRGDHVAFMSENSIPLLTAMAAAERTGLYFTPVNFHLTASEAAWIIADSTAKLVLTSAELSEIGPELRDLCPAVERWIVVCDSAPDGFETLDSALAPFSTDPVDDPQLGVAMLYSSGTTGRPKGIQRPMPDGDPREPLPVWKVAAAAYQMREGIRFLQPGPSCALRVGATVVVMERFDAERFLQLTDEHRITHTMCVPTMLHRMLRLPDDVTKKYDLSSLEVVINAAAPCAEAVRRGIMDWMGPVLWNNYGSTEAVGGTMCSPQEWMDRPGTVGRPVLGRIVILGPDDQELPAGQVGEVCFAGASNFQYFGDPEKTAASRRIDDQTTSTGDIGYVDESGYLYLMDRHAFVIISGGVNIYPQEIEDALLAHPIVADAGVFGVPDDDMGEQVKAVIELADPSMDPDAAMRTLDEYCRATFARYKRPRSYEFVEAMPRTAVGKLQKKQLAIQYASPSAHRI
jgi:acyl-CoA synthetase (AMP-forming)/AMP-acid ligase II